MKEELLHQIKVEKIFSYIYLTTALICLIGVPIVFTQFDNGVIRYGIIVPIYFLWQSWRGFKKVKGLKTTLNRV